MWMSVVLFMGLLNPGAKNYFFYGCGNFFTFSLDKVVKLNLIIELCFFVPDSGLLCFKMSTAWFLEIYAVYT